MNDKRKAPRKKRKKPSAGGPRTHRAEKTERKNRALPAFLLTMLILGGGWRLWENYQIEQAQKYPDAQTLQTATLDAAMVEALIADWPGAFAAGAQALTAAGLKANDAGASALRTQAEDAFFVGRGWAPGVGPNLFAHLMTMRYSIDRDGIEYRRLTYFRDHFQRNEDLVSEVSTAQLRQVERMIAAIESAPPLDSFPDGNVALMRYYYDDFHQMLKDAGRLVE